MEFILTGFSYLLRGALFLGGMVVGIGLFFAWLIGTCNAAENGNYWPLIINIAGVCVLIGWASQH